MQPTSYNVFGASPPTVTCDDTSAFAMRLKCLLFAMLSALISSGVMEKGVATDAILFTPQKTRPDWLDQTTAVMPLLSANPPIIFINGAVFAPQSKQPSVLVVTFVLVTSAHGNCILVLV